MYRLMISQLILFMIGSGSPVARAQLSIDAIKELFAAREEQLQEFSVDVAITKQFRESHDGPPPWPMGTRTGTYRFSYSHGKMRMSGRSKDSANSPEHFVNAEFDGSATTRVSGEDKFAFADISPEAAACFPDGRFPLDYVVSLQGRPLSEMVDLLEIISKPDEADVLLESSPVQLGNTGDLIKCQVELDASHGYSIRRVAGLAQSGSGGRWVLSSELTVNSWFPENEGIWLPEFATDRHFSWANTDVTNGIQTTGLVTGNELRFSSWEFGVNSLDELSIPDGTLVTDRVAGSRYVARNVTDQDVSDATHQKLRTSGSGYSRTILIIITGLVMTIVTLLCYFRRR